MSILLSEAILANTAKQGYPCLCLKPRSGSLPPRPLLLVDYCHFTQPYTFRESVDLCTLAIHELESSHPLTSESYNGAGLSFHSESGARGRPKYVIPREIIEYFLSNDITVKVMAEIMGVSESTVKRRMREEGLSVRDTYTEISDDNLKELVQEIVNQGNQQFGLRTVMAYLRSRGYKVVEDRVRRALREVDPVGTHYRRLFAKKFLARRRYCVPAPLSLFHQVSSF